MKRQFLPIHSDPKAFLQRPIHSDGRYVYDQTLWVKKGYKFTETGRVNHKDVGYDWSDRLFAMNWEKAQSASIEAAERVGNNNTAEYFEIYLQLFFDNPKLELVHILGGVNKASLSDYFIYGYRSHRTVSSKKKKPAKSVNNNSE